MKKVGVYIAMVAMALAATSVWAGGACCSMKKGDGAGAEERMSKCSDALGALSLTDEQKAKISEIEAACKADGGGEESCGKYMKQIRDVLTAEQQAAFDAKTGKGS